MNKNIDSKLVIEKLKWFFKSLIWLVPILIGLDQMTKWLFEIYVPMGTSITVIPNFFYFDVIHNTGAAWGSLAGNKALLISISSIASILLIAMLVWKWKKLLTIYRISLLLMLSGCVGNLIDRAFYPFGVIDFIRFQFGNYNFPTFNLADSYLVIGCIILLVAIIFEDYFSNKKVRKIKNNLTSDKINEVKKEDNLGDSNENKD